VRRSAAGVASCKEVLGLQSVFTWIGANDLASEGTWVWSDGTPWDYSNWLPGEPNGWTGENCGHFWDGPGWNDHSCDLMLGAVCRLSDGAAAHFRDGGAGGGTVRIDVSGSLTMAPSSSIRANGAQGADSGISCQSGCGDDAYNGGGGGAAGSIWITAESMLGNGSLQATGGAGGAAGARSGSWQSAGGGGAGGRIAVHCASQLASGISMSAVGGQRGSNDAGNEGVGAPGTIFTSVGGVRTLVVDNAASTSIILSENFNSMNQGSTGTQANTGLTVGFGGIATGWTASGGNAIHSVKCLRVRQRKTGETRMVAAQSKRMVSFLFYRVTTADTLEFGHILASSCKTRCEHVACVQPKQHVGWVDRVYSYPRFPANSQPRLPFHSAYRHRPQFVSSQLTVRRKINTCLMCNRE
jgi:hypothetical protein